MYRVDMTPFERKTANYRLQWGSTNNKLSDDELSTDRSSSSKLSDNDSQNIGSSDFDSSDEASSVNFEKYALVTTLFPLSTTIN